MNGEQRALVLSTVMAFLLGLVGLTLAIMTGSQAVLLDGLFNLIYFLFGLVTLRVARLVAQPDSEKYPFGYGYFESLVNAGKGLLILGVSLLALGDSLVVLFAGGREIVAHLAIIYALFASIVSAATLMLLARFRHRTHSPLVDADYENWRINTVISVSVLGAFCVIPLVRWMGQPQLAPLVDPLLVAGVVLLFCVGAPARMALRAVKELLNRAPPRRIRRPVTRAVDEVLRSLPVQERVIRMVKPGRTLYVSLYVVLPVDFRAADIAAMDRIRAELDEHIRKVYPRLVLDVVFTGDRRWVVPGTGLELKGKPEGDHS